MRVACRVLPYTSFQQSFLQEGHPPKTTEGSTFHDMLEEVTDEQFNHELSTEVH